MEFKLFQTLPISCLPNKATNLMDLLVLHTKDYVLKQYIYGMQWGTVNIIHIETQNLARTFFLFKLILIH